MSIGETLGQARRDSGLTLAQISERTRIRETVIRCIEADDYSLCGGNFYARGHIRSVARCLGLDPAPLVREYDEAHGGAPAAVSVATAFEPERPLKFRERRTPNWSAAMATVLALVIVYGIVQVFSGERSPREVAPVVAKETPAATVLAEPKPERKEAVALAPTKKDEVSVGLNAKRAVWVNIRDAAGKQLFSGLVAKGATKTWKAKDRLRVLIGNGASVELSVNGTETGVPGKDGQVLRLTFEPGSPKPV